MEPRSETSKTCRLVITRRGTSEIFLFSGDAGWSLPRMEIDLRCRIAEQLTAETRSNWSLETCYLISRAGQTSDHRLYPDCALLEAAEDGGRTPDRAFWISSASVNGHLDSADASTVHKIFQELDSLTKNGRAGPFARPGWLRELFSWAQKQLTPAGLRLTGSFRQLNASPTFNLLRLETNGGAVWFKAVGEPNARELPITIEIARLFPRYVPAIFGVHHEWNGWLAAEADGESLDEEAHIKNWERAAEALAEIQIASIPRTSDLLEAQARDLRSPNLARQIEPFLSQMAVFMSAQTTASPAPLAGSELSKLAEGLKDSCNIMGTLHLPDTIGHLDLNPANIFISEDRCTFLDWAGGTVANPFLTFAYLLEHLAKAGIEETAAQEWLTARYLAPWASLVSDSELQRALSLAPFLAVFACSLASSTWRNLDPVENPRLAGYFRGLTRRMFREMTAAGQRSESCLS